MCIVRLLLSCVVRILYNAISRKLHAVIVDYNLYYVLHKLIKFNYVPHSTWLSEIPALNSDDLNNKFIVVEYTSAIELGRMLNLMN